jgi:hypothetical protein
MATKLGIAAFFGAVLCFGVNRQSAQAQTLGPAAVAF